jgi:hypothetical protein
LGIEDIHPIKITRTAKKMKNYSHQESGELRKTLEYAEAVSLIVEQRKLDQHLGSIKKQLGALKRLSRAAVDVARSDILSKTDVTSTAMVVPAGLEEESALAVLLCLRIFQRCNPPEANSCAPDMHYPAPTAEPGFNTRQLSFPTLTKPHRE